ncbi:AMP-binding protein [Halomarina pelagica]|uniref:AMP-binding protein n=1 Tax=Halomarina pelagica TaxID=2961599 RepID=UPI0020C330C3|nr:AMP-binding protein [Halomarina sp. BND7]
MDDLPRVLGDLLARERRSDAPALLAPALGRAYDYHRLCTNAWKTGNFLRLLGVREGATVAVGDDPTPEAVLAFLGAGLLGAAVRFDPPRRVDDRALVTPLARAAEHAVGPSTKRVVYGDPPDDPRVSYFERDVWSENPTEPPDAVSPDAALLCGSGGEYSHREVLAAARRVADRLGLASDDRVAVRAPLADPGTVVAGLVAPLFVGAAVLFPDEATTGTAAVAEGKAPEGNAVAPADVFEFE